MDGLLTVAEVLRGDGDWTAGMDTPAVQAGLSSEISDVCLPAPAGTLSGSRGGVPTGYTLKPFAVIVRMDEPTQCRIADPDRTVRAALTGEEEKAIARALWFGAGGSTMWFGASDVTSVAPGENIKETVGKLLEAFYLNTVGIEPIVHLGLTAALQLGQDIDEAPSLRGTGTRVVVSPGYPTNGVAVSGDVTIRIGNVEYLEQYAWRVNRRAAEASELAAVSFDPATVFIAGEPPIQVYVADTNDLSVELGIAGHETPATIAWGDGSVDDTVAPEVGTIAHTYAAAGKYTVTVTHNGASRTVTIAV